MLKTLIYADSFIGKHQLDPIFVYDCNEISVDVNGLCLCYERMF